MKRSQAKFSAVLLALLGLLAFAAVACAAGESSFDKPKDLLWRVMNFTALVALLVFLLKKPLANALNSRRETIRTQLEELEAKRAAAERAYQECEGKLAGLEAEAKSILEEALRQGEAEKARLIAEGERAAGDMKRQAEMAVQHELTSATTRLKAEIAEEAAKAAEELIRQNLQPADEARMIESYLDKVGGVQ